MFDYTKIGLVYFLYPSINITYVNEAFKYNTEILKRINLNMAVIKYSDTTPYEFKFITDGLIIKQRLINLYYDHLFKDLDKDLVDRIVNPLVEQIHKYVCIYNSIRKYHDWMAKLDNNAPPYLRPKQMWPRVHFI